MADMQNTTLSEQEIIRRQKLEVLQQAGNDPYQITKYDVTHHASDVKANFDTLEGQIVSIAGRLMTKRVMGKASFCHVQDLSGNMQIYVARDSIGEESYKDFNFDDIWQMGTADGYDYPVLRKTVISAVALSEDESL